MDTILTDDMRQKLAQLHAVKQKQMERRQLYPHTHPELHDPQWRLILANELLILRRRMREVGKEMHDPDISLIRVGLETYARRVEAVSQQGMEVVYAELYENKSKLTTAGLSDSE